MRVDRIKYWLSVGAQPSERVAYLLWRAGLAPSPPIRWQTEANVNRKARKEAAAKRGFHTLAEGRVLLGAPRATHVEPLARIGRFATLASVHQHQLR